ncbi:MAG: branched-chain amino acid ABC transporter permease [Candidatus Latescibacteria bacterium]|nr:branched-chain amino acid ABC transporter permease [Candidatus Latescibacterota bacterium]
MGLDSYIQLFFSGITIGSIYAMVALGFLIIYSSTGIINLAQGEFVMLGGLIAVTCHHTLHFPMPLTFLVTVLLVTVIGTLFEITCIHPLKNPSVLGLIMITIAASILMRGIAMFIWGKEEHGIPTFSGDKSVSVIGASVPPQVFWILGVIFTVLIILFLISKYTLIGKAMRATAADRTAAHLVGINVRKIVLLSFAVSAGLGGVAGVVLTPMTLMSFDRGTPLALKGFCATVVGGLGNPAGTVIAGLLLGLIESFVTGLVSSHYKDVIALFILIIVLFVKPSGLFSKSEEAKLKKF